jgi:alkylation response protein AidB-like acyl-CoA dehydrogenase
VSVPGLCRANESLEERLGDPNDPTQRFSFARALDLDERDAYPDAASALLDELGIGRYYVPVSDGGRLSSYPELAGIFRAVGRRDLTAAIAHHITFGGAVHVWTAGSPTQRREIAAHIAADGRMGLAYHEQEHGSDFLATETSCIPVAGGYRLTGEKWFVNNATRGEVQTVFARTDPKGGPRGFSLFLVDKRKLPGDSFAHLPRLKTHGARGADFSGIRFTDAPLHADALLGRLGEGMELTLRSFQITRALLPALSLGAADTALRTVVDFAAHRRLLGTTVFALPRPRAFLVDAFIDLLVCECVVVGSARALHVAPEEMRFWSAACKAFVPTTVERMLANLGEILGARSFLREGPRFGIFQKIVRDHGAVPMFHAGGFMLLQTVGMGLSQVAMFRSGASASERAHFAEILGSIFSLDQTLPGFDPGRLRPYARLRDPKLGLDLFFERLRNPAGLDGVERAVVRVLASLGDALDRSMREEDASFARCRDVLDAQAPELFEFAERACALHAAAACAQIWLHNRHRMEPFLAGGEWLALSLSRILRRIGVVVTTPPSFKDAAAEHLLRLHVDHRAFSIAPWKLAGRSTSVTGS